MNRIKLKLSLAAALVTLTSATFLAKSAGAATSDRNPCNPYDSGYASGFSTAYCQAQGYSGGQVTSCQAGSGGNASTFTFYCYG